MEEGKEEREEERGNGGEGGGEREWRNEQGRDNIMRWYPYSLSYTTL